MLHRDVIVPWNLELAGYNSDLVPKSDEYFPVFQQEDDNHNKNASPGKNQISDTPNNFIAEGVGNLNNPSNSSFVVGNNQTGVGKYSVYYKHASEEGTGTTDGFTTLTNWGYMDKEGTMYEMYWNIM